MENDSMVRADRYARVAESNLPTAIDGDHSLRLVAYRRETPPDELVALVHGQPDEKQPALVRLHSACLTGEVFGSLKCDCGPQLDYAMREIRQSSWGILVYLPSHEGRGIGLINKIRAYGLQDLGADTVEANTRLGLPVDARNYEGAATALRDLGARRVRLLTNNPQKLAALARAGIAVVERVPIWTGQNRHNACYLELKRERMGHLEAPESASGLSEI
jgi:GTP cyclohydrolase II